MIEEVTRKLAMANLPEDKHQHFLFVFDKVLDCYATERTSAFVITAEGEGEEVRLGMIGINMDDQRSSMVLDTLCAYRADQLDVSNKPMN